MSLQVWLPLNGDLHNQGCSNLKFSYSGSNISVNASGKIGQCYKRTAAAADAIISDTTINLGSNQSMFCWIKMDSFQSSSSLTGILGQHRYSNNTGMGITLRYVSASSGYVSVNTGTGSARTYNSYYGSTLLSAGIWYHIGYTYDGSNIRIYVNGNLDKTQALTNMSCPAEYIQIGNWSFSGASGTGITNYSAPGCINDVRIYDHCLSAAEVKEISQGLVLHYKLDDNNLASPNLLVNSLPHTGTLASWSSAGAGWTNSITTDNEIDVVRCTYTGTTQTSGGIHHPPVSKDIYENGATYTFSGWVRASKSCKASFHNELMTNTGAQINVTTNWQFFSKTSVVDTSKTYYSNVFYVAAADATENMWIEAKQWKLEKASGFTAWIPHVNDNIYNGFMGELTNIEDNSGYNHNGTIINSLQCQNDTARYNTSINFNENADSITINPFLALNQTINQITVSCWFKTSTLNSTAPNIFSLGENSFLRSRLASATSIWSYYRVVSTQSADTYSCKTLTDNNWHLLTFVFDTGIERVYIDGAQIGSTDRSSTGTYLTCASTNWHLGGYTANSENFLGNLSDFRIYCTALSADDILSLYHTSAKVDNKQNFHTFELVENNSGIKINKRGQTLCNELEENTATKFYKTNQIIETNEIIEL